MKSVTVLIVNYKAADLVLQNLPNLTAERQGVERLDIVLVENASPDDSFQALQKGVAELGWEDRVELIRSPVNGGFAAGNNLGLRAIYARAEQPDGVLLLNPDTDFFPGALRALCEAAEAYPEAGGLGGRALNEELKPRGCCYRYPSFANEISRVPGVFHLMPEHLRETEMLVDAREPGPCDWVSGSCFLIKRAALEDVPFFDEGYFLYYEETDFCRRMNDAGWKIYHVPAARFVHVGGQSTGIKAQRAKVGDLPLYWYDSWRRYHMKN
ncbi:MAG: glycosyltransferase family 2 protein, partial [Pseudomonadota bacterium]